MTQNTRRSTTETWQAQAQETLEHSAQQEASILDLAQARFLDEARSAGAMSDMQLTDLVAEQLLERNNEIMEATEGDLTDQQAREIAQNDLLVEVINDNDTGAYPLTDHLADTAEFSQDLAQAFHRVDFDNDSVRAEAASLASHNIFKSIYADSMEHHLYDTSSTKITMGPDNFVITDVNDYEAALLQGDTQEMTVITERARLSASPENWPEMPDTLEGYSAITTDPNTIAGLALQKSSKQVLIIKEHLEDLGIAQDHPANSALDATADYTDTLKMISINNGNDANFQQAENLQESLMHQITVGATAGFVDTDKFPAYQPIEDYRTPSNFQLSEYYQQATSANQACYRSGAITPEVHQASARLPGGLQMAREGIRHPEFAGQPRGEQVYQAGRKDVAAPGSGVVGRMRVRVGKGQNGRQAFHLQESASPG